jgi:hypothetical protein
MFSKGWRWLTARFGGKQQGELRFWVHRHPRYESFWRSPTTPPGQDLRLEIQVYLEASNMAADACWIVAAELVDISAIQTVIGVRDARTQAFAPDNPLWPRQITTLSLHFLIDGQSHSSGEPFRTTVVLTDHVGRTHPVKVLMH